MKYLKCLVIFFSLISIFILVSCNKEASIYLNGDEEINIEVKSEYEELGIELPNNYSYEIIQDIDTNKLGKQEVTYIIYNKKREQVKELKRIINVVDTTAPTIIEAKTKKFYLGVGYSINDFIDNYYDNYDKRHDLKISQTEFVFNELGQQDVEITIGDSSNNVSTFLRTITIELDLVKKIEYEYQNKPSAYEVQKLTDADTGEQSEFIRAQINLFREYIEAFSFNNSIAYFKRYNSELSEYAKVEIIYDVYTKDALPFYYELWQDGNAIARIWISGFKEGNDIKFFNPSIQMNKTDHSLEEIATEAKLYIEDAITSYTEFIRNNLHLEVNDYDNLILYYSGS